MTPCNHGGQMDPLKIKRNSISRGAKQSNSPINNGKKASERDPERAAAAASPTWIYLSKTRPRASARLIALYVRARDFRLSDFAAPLLLLLLFSPPESCSCPRGRREKKREPGAAAPIAREARQDGAERNYGPGKF